MIKSMTVSTTLREELWRLTAPRYAKDSYAFPYSQMVLRPTPEIVSCRDNYHGGDRRLGSQFLRLATFLTGGWMLKQKKNFTNTLDSEKWKKNCPKIR
ncbi:MAG: hypothetical protein M3R60_10875 [Pseudomonadota bacterium]|nr:hypothetical protein [Pseudomonadota bacterium]